MGKQNIKRRQPKNKSNNGRFLVYLIVGLVFIGSIVGGWYLYTSQNVKAQFNQSEPQVATFANPDNPECPYDTPLLRETYQVTYGNYTCS